MAKNIENNIFPQLSPNAQLSEKVNLIEKNWLDGINPGFPNLVPFISLFTFFKIKGRGVLGEKNNDHLYPMDFPSNMLASGYNMKMSFVYMICCQKGDINIFMGTKTENAEILEALLEAVLGSDLCEKVPEQVLPRFQSYKGCAALTGIPNIPKTGKKISQPLTIPNHGATIDFLISGLIKERWVYMVQCFPILREQTGAWLESCADEIKNIKASYQLRDIQKADRMAVHYLELLEKTFRRMGQGRQRGMWQTGIYLFSDKGLTVSRGAAVLGSLYSGTKAVPEPLRSHICTSKSKISPFINCYHTEELCSFISLPEREYPGFRLCERVIFDADIDQHTHKPIYIGRITDDCHSFNRSCALSLENLNKHALVAGVTGAGKTNTVFHLLKQLHNIYGIPFLVIEPAKSEYRTLQSEIKSLLVFTLGYESPGLSAPFRINPFAFPEGIPLQTHIDYLKAVFDASFVMYSPMPYVLEECLYKIYQDKGWNLVTSTNYRGRNNRSFPTLTDLYHKIDEVVDNIGYQDRTTMDIKAALKTRIKNLCLGGKGMMLNSSSHIPFEKLISVPAVLELKYLGNDEEKAFMMGLILVFLWEYYESLQVKTESIFNGLRHMTVIEEAHRLLKNVPTEKTSEEQSNIKGKGVETFCNLLAEIRAYGEGMLVAEQIPSKLVPDVVKNSGLKILHRMVAREDRELMGSAMNLNETQMRHLISMNKGSAVVFFEGLDRPMKIQAPLSHEKNQAVTDKMINEYMISEFYRHNPGFLSRFWICTKCTFYQKNECEQVKQAIEKKCEDKKWKETCVKFFLPFIIEPDRVGVKEFMAATICIDRLPFHCFAAHLINDYLRSRGEFLKLPFDIIEKNIAQAGKAIIKDNFTKTAGSICRQYAGGRYNDMCNTYCRNKGFFCYEVSILAQDPLCHNRMVDLLNSSEMDSRFYIELAMLVIEFIKEFLSSDQYGYINSLAVCYLIQKLDEHRLSITLQKRILENFVIAVSRQDERK